MPTPKLFHKSSSPTANVNKKPRAQTTTLFSKKKTNNSDADIQFYGEYCDLVNSAFVATTQHRRGTTAKTTATTSSLITEKQLRSDDLAYDRELFKIEQRQQEEKELHPQKQKPPSVWERGACLDDITLHILNSMLHAFEGVTRALSDLRHCRCCSGCRYVRSNSSMCLRHVREAIDAVVPMVAAHTITTGPAEALRRVRDVILQEEEGMEERSNEDGHSPRRRAQRFHVAPPPPPPSVPLLVLSSSSSSTSTPGIATPPASASTPHSPAAGGLLLTERRDRTQYLRAQHWSRGQLRRRYAEHAAHAAVLGGITTPIMRVPARPTDDVDRRRSQSMNAHKPSEKKTPRKETTVFNDDEVFAQYIYSAVLPDASASPLTLPGSVARCRALRQRLSPWLPVPVVERFVVFNHTEMRLHRRNALLTVKRMRYAVSSSLCKKKLAMFKENEDDNDDNDKTTAASFREAIFERLLYESQKRVSDVVNEKHAILSERSKNVSRMLSVLEALAAQYRKTI
eukprot:PhM_4_TR13657/c0_g1_i4/m.15927